MTEFWSKNKLLSKNEIFVKKLESLQKRSILILTNFCKKAPFSLQNPVRFSQSFFSGDLIINNVENI